MLYFESLNNIFSKHIIIISELNTTKYAVAVSLKYIILILYLAGGIEATELNDNMTCTDKQSSAGSEVEEDTDKDKSQRLIALVERTTTDSSVNVGTIIRKIRKKENCVNNNTLNSLNANITQTDVSFDNRDVLSPSPPSSPQTGDLDDETDNMSTSIPQEKHISCGSLRRTFTVDPPNATFVDTVISAIMQTNKNRPLPSNKPYLLQSDTDSMKTLRQKPTVIFKEQAQDTNPCSSGYAYSDIAGKTRSNDFTLRQSTPDEAMYCNFNNFSYSSSMDETVLTKSPILIPQRSLSDSVGEKRTITVSKLSHENAMSSGIVHKYSSNGKNEVIIDDVIRGLHGDKHIGYNARRSEIVYSGLPGERRTVFSENPLPHQRKFIHYVDGEQRRLRKSIEEGRSVSSELYNDQSYNTLSTISSDRVSKAESKYKCKQCAAYFTSHANYQKHRTMCHFCGICKIDFVNGNDFGKHMWDHHKRPTCYKCGHCDRTFVYTRERDEHEITAHGMFHHHRLPRTDSRSSSSEPENIKWFRNKSIFDSSDENWDDTNSRSVASSYQENNTSSLIEMCDTFSVMSHQPKVKSDMFVPSDADHVPANENTRGDEFTKEIKNNSDNKQVYLPPIKSASEQPTNINESHTAHENESTVRGQRTTTRIIHADKSMHAKIVTEGTQKQKGHNVKYVEYKNHNYLQDNSENENLKQNSNINKQTAVSEYDKYTPRNTTSIVKHETSDVDIAQDCHSTEKPDVEKVTNPKEPLSSCRWYNCVICEDSFNNPLLLASHLRQIHSAGASPESCPTTVAKTKQVHKVTTLNTKADTVERVVSTPTMCQPEKIGFSSSHVNNFSEMPTKNSYMTLAKCVGVQAGDEEDTSSIICDIEAKLNEMVTAKIAPERVLPMQNLLSDSLHLPKHKKERKGANSIPKKQVVRTGKKTYGVIGAKGKLVQKPITCFRCYRIFTTKLQRNKHMKEHYQSMRDCVHCRSLTCRSHRPYISKRREGDGLEVFYCRVCPKISFNLVELKEHIDHHRKEIENGRTTEDIVGRLQISSCRKCIICGEYFKNAKYLTTHLQSHSEMRKLQCEWCAVKFFNHLDKQLHLITCFFKREEYPSAQKSELENNSVAVYNKGKRDQMRLFNNKHDIHNSKERHFGEKSVTFTNRKDNGLRFSQSAILPSRSKCDKVSHPRQIERSERRESRTFDLKRKHALESKYRERLHYKLKKNGDRDTPKPLKAYQKKKYIADKRTENSNNFNSKRSDNGKPNKHKRAKLDIHGGDEYSKMNTCNSSKESKAVESVNGKPNEHKREKLDIHGGDEYSKMNTCNSSKESKAVESVNGKPNEHKRAQFDIHGDEEYSEINTCNSSKESKAVESVNGKTNEHKIAQFDIHGGEEYCKINTCNSSKQSKVVESVNGKPNEHKRGRFDIHRGEEYSKINTCNSSKESKAVESIKEKPNEHKRAQFDIHGGKEYSKNNTCNLSKESKAVKTVNVTKSKEQNSSKAKKCFNLRGVIIGKRYKPVQRGLAREILKQKLSDMLQVIKQKDSQKASTIYEKEVVNSNVMTMAHLRALGKKSADMCVQDSQSKKPDEHNVSNGIKSPLVVSHPKVNTNSDEESHVKKQKTISCEQNTDNYFGVNKNAEQSHNVSNAIKHSKVNTNSGEGSHVKKQSTLSSQQNENNPNHCGANKNAEQSHQYNTLQNDFLQPPTMWQPDFSKPPPPLQPNLLQSSVIWQHTLNHSNPVRQQHLIPPPTVLHNFNKHPPTSYNSLQPHARKDNLNQPLTDQLDHNQPYPTGENDLNPPLTQFIPPPTTLQNELNHTHLKQSNSTVPIIQSASGQHLTTCKSDNVKESDGRPPKTHGVAKSTSISSSVVKIQTSRECEQSLTNTKTYSHISHLNKSEGKALDGDETSNTFTKHANGSLETRSYARLAPNYQDKTFDHYIKQTNGSNVSSGDYLSERSSTQNSTVESDKDMISAVIDTHAKNRMRRAPLLPTPTNIRPLSTVYRSQNSRQFRRPPLLPSPRKLCTGTNKHGKTNARVVIKLPGVSDNVKVHVESTAAGCLSSGDFNAYQTLSTPTGKLADSNYNWTLVDERCDSTST